MHKAIGVTLAYVLFVVLVNTLFVIVPPIPVLGHDIILGEIVVGGIYIVRDFAQREIGHYVIIAMIAAAAISYALADPTIALASLAAFSIGEGVDWLLFTFTKRPLSKRLLLSASLSAPVDSYVFLSMIGQVSLFEYSLMTTMKVFGVLVLWWAWRMRRVNDMRDITYTSLNNA